MQVDANHLLGGENNDTLGCNFLGYRTSGSGARIYWHRFCSGGYCQVPVRPVSGDLPGPIHNGLVSGKKDLNGTI